MTWVKICGITNLADANLAIAAGVDALGFVFAPSRRRIEVSQAKQIAAEIGNRAEKIGVFVDETPQRVREIAELVGLTGVQLHGDESPELMVEFRRSLGNKKIIKTVQVRELLRPGEAEPQIAFYLKAGNLMDAILLDSGSAEQRGGTGVPFSWEEASSVAKRIRATMPLIVAGGLNPTNVQDAIRWLQPWGVDVVSGVEAAPGFKDEAKVQDFVAAVRACSK